MSGELQHMPGINERGIRHIVRGLLGLPKAELVSYSYRAAAPSMGHVTGGVRHLHGTAVDRGTGIEHPWRLVVKTLLRPAVHHAATDPKGCVDEERAARNADAERPEHWSYWLREYEAYDSKGPLLPDSAAGLSAPACRGFIGGSDCRQLVLFEVSEAAGTAPWRTSDYVEAAGLLGAWQGSRKGPLPEEPWLCADQLAQRIARSDAFGGPPQPDWSAPELASVLPVRERLAEAWDSRARLLAALDAVPRVLSHGDLNRANLIRTAPGRITAIDWATLGLEPIGFDLGHLLLSAESDLGPELAEALLAAYAEGYGPHCPLADLRIGLSVTIALTGVSRLYWTLCRDTSAETVNGWAGRAAWFAELAASVRGGAA